jgi:hypothetical protein
MKLGYSRLLVEADMGEIIVDTWLYGRLAGYAGEASQGSYANLKVQLAEGSVVGDLLSALDMPSEVRGITFINGNLSAMPGIQPDLSHLLVDGDRVAFFDLKSMWPFQYRHGAAMIPELSKALLGTQDQGLRHVHGE